MTATKEKVKLKALPTESRGVRDASNIPMVKLVRPVCPWSQMEFEKGPDGKLHRKPPPPGSPGNCQTQGFGWWDSCQEAGHDPYHTTREWVEEVQEWTGDPDNPGQQIAGEVKAVKRRERRLNVVQVAANIRINGGKGPQFKIAQHGFRRLRDLGYAEVCMYRNCMSRVAFRSPAGLYCSRKHAALISADASSTFLHLPHQHGNPRAVADELRRIAEDAGIIPLSAADLEKYSHSLIEYVDVGRDVAVPTFKEEEPA